MRMDKLTTHFTQALQDAQSLAVGRDHQFIEPAHLMAALLEQQGGTVRGLLTKAGVNMNLLRSQLGEAIDRLPSVEGAPGDVHIGNELEQAAERDRQARAGARRQLHIERVVRARGRAVEDGFGAYPREGGRRQGRDREGHRRDSRRQQGRRPERRGEASGAREVHDRPHGARRAGKARPRDRPRRRDSPHDPGAATPHQEQPRPDRRARRRQDRHRRRSRAAHRERPGARGTQEQARALARHGRVDRGREVPRRLRGAPEGRAERSREAGRPGHPVHRRAAHDGRRRQSRGLDGRRQHAEARARARRAALRGRHDARRVPQVRREGRGARAAFPEGARGRAVGRGHDRDPARPQGEVRAASQGRDHRSRDRGGRDAVAPLHQRPAAARQGHRPHRRGRVAHPHGDGQQARGDGPPRAPPDPAQDRARGTEEGARRSLEAPACRSRRPDRKARRRVRRSRRGVEGREGGRAGRGAHQGRARARRVPSSRKRDALPISAAWPSCSTARSRSSSAGSRKR